MTQTHFLGPEWTEVDSCLDTCTEGVSIAHMPFCCQNTAELLFKHLKALVDVESLPRSSVKGGYGFGDGSRPCTEYLIDTHTHTAPLRCGSSAPLQMRLTDMKELARGPSTGRAQPETQVCPIPESSSTPPGCLISVYRSHSPRPLHAPLSTPVRQGRWRLFPLSREKPRSQRGGMC